MNLREYIAACLKSDGYDGLHDAEECGCTLDDLMPCGHPWADCEPGYVCKCPDKLEPRDAYIIVAVRCAKCSKPAAEAGEES